MAGPDVNGRSDRTLSVALWSTVMNRILLALLLVLFALPSCSGESDETRTKGQAFTEQQNRVLGFEAAPSDWVTASGAIISSSTDATQGTAAMRVVINGYTDIGSAQITAPGSARSVATFDIKADTTTPWGEARLVMQMPSEGYNWKDLGGVALQGLAPGQFHTIEFAVPEDARAALDSGANDVNFRIILNAPSGSAFTIDNLVVSDSGPGASGNLDSEAVMFSIHVPWERRRTNI